MALNWGVGGTVKLPCSASARQGRRCSALVLPVRVSCPPAVQAAALGFWRARVGPGLVYDVRVDVQFVHRVEGQCARRSSSL